MWIKILSMAVFCFWIKLTTTMEIPEELFSSGSIYYPKTNLPTTNVLASHELDTSQSFLRCDRDSSCSSLESGHPITVTWKRTQGPISSCRRRVLGLYLGVLHRYPDPLYVYHLDRYDIGSFSDMVNDFMNSEEGQENKTEELLQEPCDVRIKKLYTHVFKRHFDANGFSYFTSQCNPPHSKTFQEQLRDFVDTEEFKLKAPKFFEAAGLP